ncbi:hypothetical protein GC174_13065 [bacterium]|nr:hypothetical protein [bacterium]
MTDSLEQAKQLMNQIATWQNRAAMAKKAGRSELEQQALDHVSRYQEMLQDFEVIEPEPPGDDPFEGARVPKHPHPNAGAGAIALPLPKTEDESESEQ